MCTEIREELSNNEKEQQTFKYFLKSFHLLFFKPSVFFKNLDALNTPTLIYISLWLIGISNAVDKIEQKLIKNELGSSNSFNNYLLDAISSSWLSFFIIIACIGVFNAIFVWFIGGWFYNLRLSWSGAGDFDKNDGRLIYILSSLVFVIPHLFLLLISYIMYENYIAYFNANQYWSSIFLVFPFWSIYVSYKALVTNFTLTKWKALVWFVILPALFYLLSFALVVWLYANLG